MIQIQLLLSKMLQRQLFIVNLLDMKWRWALPASYYNYTSETREGAGFFGKIVVG